MPTIDLSVEIPALPADWQGTPDDLLQFLAVNGIFSIEGSLPAGQIGGSTPVSDVGILYGDNSIEKFVNGKYRTITDVPIGAVLAYAGTGGTSPPNYLFCTGQSLVRATYPELFTVIGVNYGTESDTTFTMPDYRGRVAVGAGVGNYEKQGGTGNMDEVVASKYSGYEWIRTLAKGPGASMATTVLRHTAYVTTANPTATFAYPPRIGQQFIIRYR